MKENKENQNSEEEVGKTKVMSLSELSTKEIKDSKLVEPHTNIKKEIKDKTVVNDKEEALVKQEKTIVKDIKEVQQTKAVEQPHEEEHQPASASDDQSEDSVKKVMEIEVEKDEIVDNDETKINEQLPSKKDVNPSTEDKIEVDDEVKMTLEEKRKKDISNRMTIEERRDLQKQGKLSILKDDKKSIFDSINKVDYAFLIINMLMSWFITFHIFEYFNLGFAMLFFFGIHAILVGIFFLNKKKRKIGLAVNIAVCILIFALSVFTYRIGNFTNQIFNNSEAELVMLIARKDSTITENDDFKDKKIAFIKSDGDTNTFAKEMLSEAKKDNYNEVVYVTYKEAYEALMSKDVDMMIYTSFTKQRLEEEDIQSTDEIKIVMQRSRALKPVVSNKVDITKDPFNIYISGVDLTSVAINEKGSSDVNIIMSINPKTKKIIMQTIPRDTWAGLTCSNGNHTKLTYAGAYGGIDCSINTIEDYLGIEINYYAKINFQGVIDLVDALGGITVNSDVAFCEGPPIEGQVREYCYNAGLNTLNGVRTLMFARIRKVFSDGDVERGRHQMEVVNAVIRKFSESPSLGNFNALLGAVENNFTTNLDKDDIGKGLELFLGMQDSLTNIKSVTMEGELVWKTDEVSNEYLYYFIPNEGQIDLVKQRVQDVMDGK